MYFLYLGVFYDIMHKFQLLGFLCIILCNCVCISESVTTVISESIEYRVVWIHEML